MTGIGSFVLALNAETLGDRRQGWVHLIPRGEFTGRDGRGPWSLPDPAAVIAATMTRSRGAPLPVDYEHQTDLAPQNGQPAPAAGWIVELQARRDGLWGLVEWTERAASYLAGREYRFLSPVFTHSGPQIGALLRAGLTNKPNLELTALASESPPTMDISSELRSMLGLPAEAQPDAIVEAVRSLTQRIGLNAEGASDQFVPMAVFERVAAELNRMSCGVSEQAAVICVDREIAAGRLMPALRDWGITLCGANKPAFDGFITRTAGGLEHLFQERLPGAPAPAGRPASDLDVEIARQLGHNPKDLTLGTDR